MIQELEIKVNSILTDVCGLEEHLYKIEWDCENCVKNMRRKEASFSECSSFLQNWDNKLAIYISKLVQFVVDLPQPGMTRRQEEDQPCLKLGSVLSEKITRKYEAVC